MRLSARTDRESQEVAKQDYGKHHELFIVLPTSLCVMLLDTKTQIYGAEQISRD